MQYSINPAPKKAPLILVKEATSMAVVMANILSWSVMLEVRGRWRVKAK
jgi:hypothetical protein